MYEIFLFDVLLFVIMINNDFFFQQFSGTENNSLGYVCGLSYTFIQRFHKRHLYEKCGNYNYGKLCV